MKLTVISHACVTPVNQAFFARVEEQSGWEVSLIVPRTWRNEYGEQRAERWPQFRGTLVDLPVRLAGNIPLHFYRARLFRMLRELSPDVLYIQHEPYALGTTQALFAARALPRLRIALFSVQNLAKSYPWPFSAFERAAYHRADITFPSPRRSPRSSGARGTPARCTSCRCRSRCPRSYPPVTERRDCGRLHRTPHTRERVDTILDALARLRDRPVRAVIVGSGSQEGELRAYARERGVDDQVEWRGYMPHARVGEAYTRLDVLAAPSRTIGLDGAVRASRARALAHGVAVAAAASGELPRLISETGGGWTFPEGDPDALASVLAGVAEDPGQAREKAARGRGVVIDRFSLDRVVATFITAVADGGSR